MTISFESPTFPIKGLTSSYAVSASWAGKADTASYAQGSDGQAVVNRTEFNTLKSNFERVSGSVESKSGSWDATSHASAGSTKVPVYISGGLPHVVTSIEGIPVKASTLKSTGAATVNGSTTLGNGLDMLAGDFYLSGAGDFNGSNKESADTVQEVLRKQGAALTALAAGAKVTLTPSPSTIYKATNTSVTLTGTLSNVTPSSMTIYDGNTVIATTQSSARVQGSTTVNTTSNSKSFRCEAIYMGVAIIVNSSINARYPIYYGFGTTYTSVTTKVGATTTAVRTYTGTATANGQHFYIMVPSDIADVTQFAMGGAPFAMNAVSTQTIGGVSYKVHESAVAYNSGTTVSVAAS